MTYTLIDSEDNVFDLASNQGMKELEAAATTPLFKKLLDEGELLEDEVQELIAELEGGPLQYIADGLRKLEGGIIISNGIEDEAEE